MKIYLAGGLFNSGERLHNLFLEKYLKELGYDVVLPQREALKAFNGKAFDVKKIVRACRAESADPENILVGCADGADSDSGTCVEYAFAIAATGRAVVYRTDFRTALDRELGINAMLTGDGTEFVYEPCFFTELSEVGPYYKGLAIKIDEAIKKISSNCKP